MSTLTSGNSIVDAVASMQFTGNVIPQIWYKRILKDTGKPDLLAIVLLADIVYWYRPTEERDEVTGQLVGFRKKFNNDLLQRNYEQLAEQFGESKRNIRDAITRLEKLGIIKRQFRTIETPTGVRCNNVLFIELVPERLFEITHNGAMNTPMTKKGNRYDENIHTLLPKNAIGDTQDGNTLLPNYVIGGTQKSQTNTKNTTETTTEIILSSSIVPLDLENDEDDDELKKRIGYRKAFEEYQDTAAVLYEELQKDSNSDIAESITEKSFLELCKSITEYSSPIRNLSAYIRTCLSNMAAGQKVRRKNYFNRHLKQGYDIAELEKNILAN